MNFESIAKYQIWAQASITNGKANGRPRLDKRRKGKGSCTRHPRLRENKMPISKHLRKRLERLYARQRDWQATINSDSTIPEGTYTKPGSMR